MAEAPFGQNVLIRVSAFTPKNSIGEGTIWGIGPWVSAIFGGAALKLGQVVKFRITTSGAPPKEDDEIYVKLDDVFAIVSEPGAAPHPEMPESAPHDES